MVHASSPAAMLGSEATGNFQGMEAHEAQVRLCIGLSPQLQDPASLTLLLVASVSQFQFKPLMPGLSFMRSLLFLSIL